MYSARPQFDNEDDLRTIDPELKSKGLDTLIVEGESSRDQTKPYAQIGYRSSAKGFRPICFDIAKRYNISSSQFFRHSTKLGSAILQSTPEMQNLKCLSDSIREGAMNSGNLETLERLDQEQPYNFIHSSARRSTMSVIWWVQGNLGTIARTTGLPVGKLAIIAVLAAINTLPNERGYKESIRRELGAFWQYVDRRTKILSIK